jgi:hypothetical protein
MMSRPFKGRIVDQEPDQPVPDEGNRIRLDQVKEMFEIRPSANIQTIIFVRGAEAKHQNVPQC